MELHTDMDELESLFAVKSQKKAVEVVATQKKEGAAAELLVLEAQRARNIVIGLAQFKQFGTHAELFQSVCALDKRDGALSTDKVEN